MLECRLGCLNIYKSAGQQQEETRRIKLIYIYNIGSNCLLPNGLHVGK
jgi:hypothetical protein